VIKEFLKHLRRAPLHVKLLTVLGLLYLLSPIDLIPDFIPVLGQADDVIVAGLLLKLLTKYLPDELRAQLPDPGKLLTKIRKK
jgi:uncharacterized membrane protein YkvA (DUF1232 family)